MNASLLLLLLAPVQADQAFRSQIRPTDPLSPEEQQQAFDLPDGFQIQLFAAEPDIVKPMNMAFDGAGRLWVSGSLEYPYAADEGEGRDAIKVLEDTDGDGRADRATTFVDQLNIPIGLYPYRDGVVAYSIPNIWFFRDTDGDGRADRRDVLYGPLGTPRDTHGMQNAFRRGFDGWLYINHGFANESTLSGSDGSQIQMQSGNVYRVRLDGSRVEQFTWGQVNPFGSAFTPQGDLITSDCHSKPLTLLLRGGYYPSFGKPHDGLGFVPAVMDHGHGSTAIDGACCCADDRFPPEMRGSLLVGNVMTSRVNRDELIYHGSTIVARETEDLVKCDDPWFRPVDIQLGPDGALYVADFYDRIIGHYEVPLDHPGRDRTRGRIWRISYHGPDGGSEPTPRLDLHQADAERLIEALADGNLTRRLLASDQLSDRIGPGAAPLLREAAGDRRSTVRVHSLWALHRLGQLTPQQLATAAADGESLVRIHAQRLLAEHPTWNDELRELAENGLGDSEPLVRRAAADALGTHVDPQAILPLLNALPDVAPRDVHLRQMIRISLKQQLSAPAAWDELAGVELTAQQRRELADVALAVPTEAAAALVVRSLAADKKMDPASMRAALAHAAAQLPTAEIERLVDLVNRRVPDDLNLQLDLLNTMQAKLRQRGAEHGAIRQWGERLAQRLLDSVDDASLQWSNQGPDNPWGLEPRRSADGQGPVMFLSSLPGGEQQTAVLRSATFTLPAKLSFYLCGHRGFPDKPASDLNLVRLRLASGEVVAHAMPPRNDVAQRIQWDLSAHQGQQGWLEVVDGLSLNAYAWLAVARFEPAVLAVPKLSPTDAARRLQAVAQLAGQWKLLAYRQPLTRMLQSESSDWSVRAAAARALLALRPDVRADALAEAIDEPVVDGKLRSEWCQLIADSSQAVDDKTLQQAMQAVPARLQQKLALRLAGSREGAEVLLALAEQGHASARLLRDEPTRQSVLAAGAERAGERVQKLLDGLPPLNQELQRLIAGRLQQYQQRAGQSQLDHARGRTLFDKHCAACHQVAGQGKVIGPQLDGIGNRGLERIVEDVLDPARNVDRSFRSVLLALDSGQVVNGLLRRQEGQTLVLADSEGKEVTVPQSEIRRRRDSTVSIMPNNFGELLKEDEFCDLTAFLLTCRAPLDGEEEKGSDGEGERNVP